MPACPHWRSQPSSTLALTASGRGWTTPVSTSSAASPGCGMIARSGMPSWLGSEAGEAPDSVAVSAPEAAKRSPSRESEPVWTMSMPVHCSKAATEASKRSASVPPRAEATVTCAGATS